MLICCGTLSLLHLRIFLSSPGDVADERNVARALLKEYLPYTPGLRGRVIFDIVSWDDPAAQVAMLANETPQESVNRALPRPADCDIVVVILWSRIGTALPDDICKSNGERYASGTEWEYEDAIRSPSKPAVLVYRRMEEPKFGARDPQLKEKLGQYEQVEQFFGRFRNSDGSPAGGINTYSTSSEFKDLLRTHVEQIVWGCLGPAIPRETVTLPQWEGSPYPGLRAFTTKQATIFFGRERETDALIDRLRDPDHRFLAVVAASGTGKSSLVRAGLLPRLANGAIEGSQHWCILTFTPAEVSDNPFQVLATKLSEVLPLSNRKPAREIALALTTAPQRITEYAAMILAGRSADAALMLIIDQLEELFTLVTAAHRATFIDILAHATGDPRLRVLATLRADFLLQCTAEPKLAALLQGPAGIFPLGPPGPLALTDMIRKPAERAGLVFEEALVEAILKDAGSDSGVLPLVAFCLEALYRPDQHRLTLAAYEDLGRLHGAIGRQANALLTDLRHTEGRTLDTALPQLFRALVHVDAAGTATRRRAFRDELGTEPSMPRLVETLVQGRLLMAEEIGGRATITLSHEVLLTAWPDLCEWLDRNRTQMQRLQRCLNAPDPRDRRRATAALGEIGPVEPEVVPVLIRALGDADEGVRNCAAWALGQIGPAAAEAVPALITALGDAEPSRPARSDAAFALGRIGPAAVPALITALGDADAGIRSNAAFALDLIGPAAAEAVPALITALDDAHPDYS